MPDTSRRVNVTLTAATNENAHQVMGGILDAVRNALPGLSIVASSTHAFDLNDADDESEPLVQIVVDETGIARTYIDRPDRADDHARNIGGVVVTLAIEVDHRREEAGRDDR